jgi:mono/diheme cytochrome c family protein
MRRWILAPVLAIALAAAGSAPAAAEADGKALFEKNCMKCHGADGSADTPAGKKMKVPSLKGEQLVAADVVKNVRENSKHKPVSKKVPSDADLEAIAAYMVTLTAGP